MPMFLAVDAGGTSTRAVALGRLRPMPGLRPGRQRKPDVRGDRERGRRRSRRRPSEAGAGPAPDEADSVAVSRWPGRRPQPFREQIDGPAGGLGSGRSLLEPDLLGIFHSGTHLRDGYALIAGTGTSPPGSAAAGWTGWSAAGAGCSATPAAASGSDTRWPGPWSPRWTGRGRRRR